MCCRRSCRSNDEEVLGEYGHVRDLRGELYAWLFVMVFVVDLQMVERREVRSPLDEYNECLLERLMVKPQQVNVVGFRSDCVG